MRQRPPVPRGCHFAAAVTIRWVKPEEGTARARGEPGAGAAPAVGQRCPGGGRGGGRGRGDAAPPALRRFAGGRGPRSLAGSPPRPSVCPWDRAWPLAASGDAAGPVVPTGPPSRGPRARGSLVFAAVDSGLEHLLGRGARGSPRAPHVSPAGRGLCPPGRVRPWRPPRQVLPAPPAPQLRWGRTGGEHAGKGGCSPGARSPPPASAETRLPESARRAESSLRLTLKPVIHVFMGPKRLPGESAQVD